jgi:hypothetical protein
MGVELDLFTAGGRAFPRERVKSSIDREGDRQRIGPE